MAEILPVQIACLFGMAVVNFGAVLLPLKIYQRNGSDQGSEQFQRILTMCNCVAGGIFLGTCFIGLLPMVDEKFEEVFNLAEIRIKYPVTETTVVLGFFLILLIEQVVHCIQARKNRNHSHPETNGDIAKKITVDDPGYTASDEESEDTEETIFHGTQDQGEKMLLTKSKRIERKPSKKEHGKNSKSQPVNEHGHSHDHEGHSHITGALTEESSLRCLILLLALATHSVFEGVALGLQSEVPAFLKLYVAVISHEILCAFALGISFAQHSVKTKTMLKLAVFFSLTIPCGMVIGMAVGKVQGLPGVLISAILQGIALGTFIYALFMEIIPSALKGSSDHLLKTLFLFFGYILMAGITVLE